MKTKFSWKKFKLSKTYLIIIGITATLWFLVRVIPKPSRARYPCMQAAAPLMSSFVIYLLAISGSVFSIKKVKQSFRTSKYLIGLAFILLAVLSFSIIIINDTKDSIADVLNPVDDTFPVASNTPIGEAKGLFPGRVVWVQDEDATNEDYIPKSGSNDYWYTDKNVNGIAIEFMLELAILEYAEKDNLEDAWDAIFRSYNKTHGRGDVGYTPGEKIAFKINLTNQSCSDRDRPTRMDATPQLLNAILYQLVENAGVSEQDITLGDPYRQFRLEYRRVVAGTFPDVNYVDGRGAPGVKQTKPSEETVLFFAGKDNNGKTMSSTLPQQYLDATYVINVPCLKTHDEGGITLIAKNHQGSYLKMGEKPEEQYAIAMHYSLPRNNRGSKKYRHTVDYMGHEQTGGKGLIYIVDGIWAGDSWQGYISKFKSDPFNNDYPNSIFVGQDPVALESVCFDILFQENVMDDDKGNYPVSFKVEVADHLMQCASSEYWPDGLTYDPERDGIPLKSLGVFEHWNNPTDRLYSRNLGTGDGIELKYFKNGVSGISSNKVENINIASPNPFSISTKFVRPVSISKNSDLEIYNLNGQVVKTFSFNNSDVVEWNGSNENNILMPDGLYVYKIRDNINNSLATGKVILRK